MVTLLQTELVTDHCKYHDYGFEIDNPNTYLSLPYYAEGHKVEKY